MFIFENGIFRYVMDKPADAGNGGDGEGAAGAVPAADEPKPKGLDAEIAAAMAATDEMSGDGTPEPDGEIEKAQKPPAGEADGDADADETIEQENKKPAGEDDASGDGDEVVYREGFEPDDVVEVEGSSYFYHPQEHAPDSGQSNAYRSRDDAEISWPHKITRITELTEKLNELGKGIGPVDLPDWFGSPDNIDGLKQKGDLDEAMQLPNSELRKRLAEGDKLISYLNQRVERVDKQAQQQNLSNDLTQRVETIYKSVDPLIDELGLDSEINRVKDINELHTAAEQAVQKRIQNDLKPLVKEYEDYKNNDDARYEDRYPEILEAKRDAVRDKERELQDKYKRQYLSPFEQAVEVEKEIADFKKKQQASQGMSAQERIAKMNEGFLDLQAELGDKHDIFLAANPTAANAFRDWAVKRAEKFNGLLDSRNWGEALRAFEKHTKQRRAEIRRKKLEAAGQDTEKPAPEKPAYGDQTKLTDRKKPIAPRDKAKLDMEALVEETEAALK